MRVVILTSASNFGVKSNGGFFFYVSPENDREPQAVFTFVMRAVILTSASNFGVKSNGGFIFDVSPENDRASPKVKSPNMDAITSGGESAGRGPQDMVKTRTAATEKERMDPGLH